jgi:hypothetical protein
MRLTEEREKALTQDVCVRYLQTGSINKKAILDEFTTTTGYNGNYVIRLLNAREKHKRCP